MISIAIGTDHRGYDHKMVIQAGVSVETKHIEWIDVGAFSAERSDYPIFGIKVVEAIKKGNAQLGILLCGTGTGMAVVANRFSGIYAGVAWDEIVARRCREEDNVNILVLAADLTSPAECVAIVQTWLNASFKGGRYAERIGMIDSLK